MSVKKKAIHGIAWTGLAKASMQGMLFLLMIVLARLLSPEDFGIVGMAAIITVAVSMVNDRGLGTAIVQKSAISRGHLDSVFWGGIGFSIILYLASLAASWPLALFFKNPMVQPVVAIQALGFIIGSLGIVQKSLLNKTLEFKKLAILEVVSVLVSGIISITMALSGFGVWSLVLSTLIRDGVGVLLVWIYCDWRPRLHYSGQEFRELFRFSAQVLGVDVASYAVMNVDVLIIGRLLGSEALGYYSLALNLVKMPVTRLSAIVSKVAFPAFAAIQEELDRLHHGYLKATTLLSIITFPILLGMALFAREFILVFMGEKWLPMALPLIIMIPIGLTKAVGTIRWPVLLALGRPEVELKWNLAYLAPLVAALYFGARYGLAGASAGVSLLLVLTFPFIQGVSDRLIRMPALNFYKSVRPAALAGVVMCVATLAIKAGLASLFTSPLLLLLLGLFCSAAIYLLVLYMTGRQQLLELREYIGFGKKGQKS